MADQGNVILALLGQLLQGRNRGLPPLSQMMRGQQVMPGLYDPTGMTFEHPSGGISTELNGIWGGDGEPYRMMPTLVPGQTGIENILAGVKLTPEQIMRIIAYAKSRSSEVPKFNTLEDAEQYEQKRHQGLEAGYGPNPRNPQDLLSSLLMSLPR